MTLRLVFLAPLLLFGSCVTSSTSSPGSQSSFAKASTFAKASADKSADKSGDKPNILLVLVDDLGWSDLGCYGNPAVDTPRIDAFCRESVKFTDAYAAAPV